MTGHNEQIIIQKVISGDTRAFAILVDSYKDMAVLIAYNILLNQEDAEEIAQDAFIKAYTGLSSFKFESRFSTWLYRIVVNKALNKKKLKKSSLLEITDAIAEEVSSDVENFPLTPITADHKKYIQAALQTLSINERLCLTLFYLNELSVEKIHEMTGLSLSNIKVLLYRGRKNLYTALHRQLKTEITNLIKS